MERNSWKEYCGRISSFFFMFGIFFFFSLWKKRKRNTKTREWSKIWGFYIYSLSVANYFLLNRYWNFCTRVTNEIPSLLRHLSNSVTLFILVGITMCVKGRDGTRYKSWTVLKGKWTGRVIVSVEEEESKGYVPKACNSFERLGLPSPAVFGEDEDGSWKICSY